MLDSPGALWLFIFIVSYEIGKATVSWLWDRRKRTSNQDRDSASVTLDDLGPQNRPRRTDGDTY